MSKLTVYGLRAMDEEFAAKKAVYDACIAANVTLPPEIAKFFSNRPPEAHGVHVNVNFIVSESLESADSKGVILDLTKLPEDVDRLKIWYGE